MAIADLRTLHSAVPCRTCRRSQARSTRTSVSSAAGSPAAPPPSTSPSGLPRRPARIAPDRLRSLRSQRRTGDGGLACGQDKLEREVGFENARRMWDISVEGLRLIRDRVQRHAIDCDLHWGQVHVAIKERQRGDLLAERRALEERYGYRQLRFMDRADVESLLATMRYSRGLLRSRQRPSASAELHSRTCRRGSGRWCKISRAVTATASITDPSDRQHRAWQPELDSSLCVNAY